jgi:TRAF3-interacting protein 1
MSSSNINAAALEDITKKTTDILSRVVKKTPLNAKLLSKPPFRYLHDMFSEIIKISGVAKGLYSDNEMNSENVKVKNILFRIKSLKLRICKK